MSARDYLALLDDDAAKITYSQMGEDVVVYHLPTKVFNKMDRGFYVDVGAYHPRMYSNTRFLNMVGWHGINIDASGEAIAQFSRERPQDINVCCGVGVEEADVPFYEFANSSASTISPQQAKLWQKELGWNLVTTSTVHVRPLNSILEEFLPAGQQMDYMNVHLEGMDGEVIKSLDFSRFRPKVLTIELHDIDKLALGRVEAKSYIVHNGYRLESMNLMTFAFTTCTSPKSIGQA